MLYEIDKKYYVKVGNKFAEISFSLENDELVITPKANTTKIENNNNLVVREFNLESEKEKIIDTLKKEKDNLFHKEKSFTEKSFGRSKFTNQR